LFLTGNAPSVGDAAKEIGGKKKVKREHGGPKGKESSPNLATGMESLSDAASGARAVQFDGATAYLSAGNPEDLQIEGAITLEACVLNAADPRPGQRRMPHRNIVAHGHDRITEAPALFPSSAPCAGLYAFAWVGPCTQSGVIDFRRCTGCDPVSVPAQVFLRVNLFSMQWEVGTWIGETDSTSMAAAKIEPGDFGTWVHIAGVFDGSSWTLFRNGTAIATKPASTGSVRVRGSEWAIGAKGDGGDRFWKGCIAHVSIWGKARSQQEIASTVSAGLTGSEDGLLRYWELDDGGGRSVHELVGDHDGELKGALKWVVAAEVGAGAGGDDDLYKLLGVSRGASDAEIKKAYRTAALKYHPDRNPGPDGEEKFKKIQGAYEILVDAQKRKRYDAMGMDGVNEQSSGLDPLQEMLMRQMGMSMGGGLPKARDVAHALHCTLEDVYNGADKVLEFKRINSPRGTQKNDSKSVRVEKGMDHNAKIVWRDDGDYVPGQCEAGNRIVVVQLETHPVFLRKGDDLLAEARISLLQSLVGGAQVAIQHLDGRWLTMTTPFGEVSPQDRVVLVPGVSTVKAKRYSALPCSLLAARALPREIGYEYALANSARARARGISPTKHGACRFQEGMPRRGDPFSKGDLYVQFKVDFPSEELEEDARRLLRQALPASTGDADADGAARELVALDLEADDVEHVFMRQADASQMVRLCAYSSSPSRACASLWLPIGLAVV